MNAQELKELRAKNLGIEPTMVGKEFPTQLGGVATITAHNATHDAYKTKTGLWWKIENDLLVGYDGLKNGE